MQIHQVCNAQMGYNFKSQMQSKIKKKRVNFDGVLKTRVQLHRSLQLKNYTMRKNRQNIETKCKKK